MYKEDVENSCREGSLMGLFGIVDMLAKRKTLILREPIVRSLGLSNPNSPYPERVEELAERWAEEWTRGVASMVYPYRTPEWEEVYRALRPRAAELSREWMESMVRVFGG